MNSTGINTPKLDGLLMAEAVDGLYWAEAERQVARLVDHWGPKSPPAVYLLGHLSPDLWGRFTNSNRRPIIDREHDRLEVTYAISPDMRDFLARARLDWFERAVEPLLIALHSGEFSASGIREPGSQHGWQREVLPAGLFEAGHWVLFRKESRLIEVDRKGEDTGVAYSAVKVHRLDRGRAVPDGADGVQDAPTKGVPELNESGNASGPQAAPKEPPAYRTEFPGRPSIKNLVMRELERRARDGQMLGTVTAESEALAEWASVNHPDAPSSPRPRTIENQIRTKFRELARTKQ